MSGSDHVGLKQGTLQVDVVVGQGFVNSSKDLLSNVLAALQVVVTIRENLRLNNGDDAVLRKAETKRVKMTGGYQGKLRIRRQEIRTAVERYCVSYLCIHYLSFQWFSTGSSFKEVVFNCYVIFEVTTDFINVQQS